MFCHVKYIFNIVLILCSYYQSWCMKCVIYHVVLFLFSVVVFYHFSKRWCMVVVILGESSYDTSMYNNINVCVNQNQIGWMRSIFVFWCVRKGILGCKFWHEMFHLSCDLSLFSVLLFYHVSKRWCMVVVILGEYSYDTSMYNNINFCVNKTHIDWMRSTFVFWCVQKGFFGCIFGHEMFHLSCYLSLFSVVMFYHVSKRWWIVVVMLCECYYDTSM